MKNWFKPILGVFEAGEGDYRYEKSHRRILVLVGVLFLVLAVVSAVVAIAASQVGGVFPFLVFFLIGLVCEVVGIFGSDRAVARIWGNR